MPEPVVLLNAFNLPPEKAVEYFRSKGYRFSWDWHDTWQEAHARAFTVAKAMRMDILKDIREMIDRAISEGLTFSEFKKELEPRLKAKGWWGKKLIVDETGAQQVQLGSPWRLKTIYRVNTQTAYMAGRYRGMMDVAQRRPYWQYIAVLDSRTRPAHRMLHGKVFPYDDPFWKSFYPPNGWNCRCRVRSLSERELKRKGLTVEHSKGKLFKEDRLVSPRTGELQEVTVYKDPLTGEKIAPDVGWSYNPGSAAWQPDLDAYPYEVARQYIQGALTGPAFRVFFEGKSKGRFPVAVMSEEEIKTLGAKRQTIWLSSESLAKNRQSHPELSLEDYQLIPEIVAYGEVYQQRDERIIYLWKDGYLYRASVKTTKDREENYLLSLFKTTDKTADRGIRRKYKRIR